MEPWIQKTRNGFVMAEEEMNRLEASPAQGEQSCAVQSDMKAWALKSGLWPQMHYRTIIDRNAEARGWDQVGFTGMEIVDETV